MRPGDVVALEENALEKKGTKARQERGVVFRVTDTLMTIAIDDAQGKSKSEDDVRTDFTLPPTVRVVKLVNEVTYTRMEKSLDTLVQVLGMADPTSELGAAASSTVRSLFGLHPPTWEKTSREHALHNARLNTTQKDALDFCMRAQQFALVHGPPGTGKTTLIAELVVQLACAHPNARILVCGASNLAVDNLLERVLLTHGYKEPLNAANACVTRIGHPARVLPSLTNATLDVQTTHSSEGMLVREVAQEIEQLMSQLAVHRDTPRAGNKSGRTAPRPKGAERRKMWEQVRELRKEYRKRERSLTGTILQRARIVMATCHGAGSRQLQNIEFDYVIIDEAAQALEAACWTAILKLKSDGKLFLAGDHLQLPPTVKAQNTRSDLAGHLTSQLSVQMENGGALRPPMTLETTLFDRLLAMYGDDAKALLRVQYRMNDEIMAFPNEALYEGKLLADPSCSSIRLCDSNTEEMDAELWNAPVVFYDTTGTGMFDKLAEDDAQGSLLQSKSRCNENEVVLVERHITMLVEHGIDPSWIAVLSPYASQVDLLSSQLGQKYEQAIEIGTVDGMQGREKEVVVISLVRSNEEHDVGFLQDKRRLNVAMTRAKRQFVVVGDAETISGSAQDKRAARAFLRDWIDHLHSHALVEMNPEV
ncbi:DNA helicase [Malassezia vespertilionis]|uniref:AAA+ ATPase domain-containing protein n=1 Tax=Malassezia vespertilionis TaxID=2020962 RepID=A0A2N1J907_9BASI|nr:DNA helicase [Malassezia vespertilionis]PKI83047.1 hypothetical protein MVES_002864 [Malassezia vespertilionis]WFD07656.1 DNA helicase [Malassezia vespertilionis]